MRVCAMRRSLPSDAGAGAPARAEGSHHPVRVDPIPRRDLEPCDAHGPIVCRVRTGAIAIARAGPASGEPRPDEDGQHAWIRQRRRLWARLIARIQEVDPLTCTRYVVFRLKRSNAVAQMQLVVKYALLRS